MCLSVKYFGKVLRKFLINQQTVRIYTSKITHDKNVSNEKCSRPMFKLFYTSSKSVSPLSNDFVDDALIQLMRCAQYMGALKIFESPHYAPGYF